MLTVWVRGEERYDTRFHMDRECPFLNKRSPHGGPGRDVREVPLDELRRPTPCLYCRVDAPRARSVHLRCRLCNKGRLVKPCVHNGGVPVFKECVHRKHTTMSEAGDTYVKQIFVWPEMIRHHLALDDSHTAM